MDHMKSPSPLHINCALHYYDYFRHPLTAREIHRAVQTPCRLSDVQHALNQMVHQGDLVCAHGFYAFSHRAENIQKRQQNQHYNDRLFAKARKMQKVVSSVPFVRAFGISGSLSKHGATAISDIDFFIITAPKCVWLVKALLILYKRLFLRNSHKYLCVNYVVSTDALRIREENIFQATEIATLIPLYGHECLHSFFRENQWVQRFFPNFTAPPKQHDGKIPWWKYTAEKLLTGPIGNWANQKALLAFKKHALRKYGPQNRVSKMTFEQEVSKYFPEDMQLKIIKYYDDFAKTAAKREVVGYA